MNSEWDELCDKDTFQWLTFKYWNIFYDQLFGWKNASLHRSCVCSTVDTTSIQPVSSHQSASFDDDVLWLQSCFQHRCFISAHLPGNTRKLFRLCRRTTSRGGRKHVSWAKQLIPKQLAIKPPVMKFLDVYFSIFYFHLSKLDKKMSTNTSCWSKLSNWGQKVWLIVYL